MFAIDESFDDYLGPFGDNLEAAHHESFVLAFV